jgi:hypothetical protein
MGTQLDGILSRLASLEKRAGDDQGGTSHPVDKLPNQTQPSAEGERSAENDKDVASLVGANNVPNGTIPSQSQDNQTDQQMQQGAKKSAIGEDSAAETPKETAPQDTNVGIKSAAAVRYAAMPMEEKVAALLSLGERVGQLLLEDDAPQQKNAAAAPVAAPGTITNDVELMQAWAEGRLSKEAEDRLLAPEILGMIQTTLDLGNRAGDYLDVRMGKAASANPSNLAGFSEKRGEGMPGEMPMGMGGGDPMGASADPMAALMGGGGGAPAAPPMDPQAMLAMLLGGQGGGAPMGGPPMGGDPMAADPLMALLAGGGGDPAAAGGAPPMEGGGPPSEEGPPKEESSDSDSGSSEGESEDKSKKEPPAEESEGETKEAMVMDTLLVALGATPEMIKAAGARVRQTLATPAGANLLKKGQQSGRLAAVREVLTDMHPV